MKFDVILSDVPWQFETYSEKGKGRSPENHYPVLTLGEIASLRVAELAAENSALFFWVTFPFLFHAKDIIESWGFSYRTVAFAWAKTTTLGFPKLFSVFEKYCKKEIGEKDVVDFWKNGLWHMGNGYYTRGNVELCILAVRGRMAVADRGVRNLVVSPVKRHSAKPKTVYSLIERLYPDRRYLELFARERRDGWVQLGNEIDGKDIRDAIAEKIGVGDGSKSLV